MSATDSIGFALAATALDILQTIREHFPIEGRPWRSASVADPEPAMGAMRTHARNLARCVYVFYQDEAPSPTGAKMCTRCRELGSSPDDPPQVCDLVAGLRQVLGTYGWWVWMTGNLDTTGKQNPPERPWVWPDVPPVGPELLDRVEMMAKSILGEPGPDGEGQSSGTSPRPTSRRNQLWLSWYDDPKGGEHHSPTKIKDRWNAMSQAERAAVAPRASGKVASAETVKKGIRAARADARMGLAA